MNGVSNVGDTEHYPGGAGEVPYHLAGGLSPVRPRPCMLKTVVDRYRIGLGAARFEG